MAALCNGAEQHVSIPWTLVSFNFFGAVFSFWILGCAPAQNPSAADNTLVKMKKYLLKYLTPVLYTIGF